jgi:acetoin utilization deacetylase AcuC-like enzyme
VDFDVHHGNGTQAVFADDAELFYASSHQSPCYPGTGAASEQGCAGNVVNRPLPPGTGSAGFRGAWAETILPAVDRFAPELLIVSAGFDAHKADPLAQLRVETADFAWLTGELMRIAERHCDERIVSVLEGGYDLDALAACAAAHVRVLMRAG